METSWTFTLISFIWHLSSFLSILLPTSPLPLSFSFHIPLPLFFFHSSLSLIPSLNFHSLASYIHLALSHFSSVSCLSSFLWVFAHLLFPLPPSALFFWFLRISFSFFLSSYPIFLFHFFMSSLIFPLSLLPLFVPSFLYSAYHSFSSPLVFHFPIYLFPPLSLSPLPSSPIPRFLCF